MMKPGLRGYWIFVFGCGHVPHPAGSVPGIEKTENRLLILPDFGSNKGIDQSSEEDKRS